MKNCHGKIWIVYCFIRNDINRLKEGALRTVTLKKRGGACHHFRQLSPPLLYSLLQPLEEHAGRLKRDNFDLLYTFDTPNTSSWFLSQPKDESLKLKTVQSL